LPSPATSATPRGADPGIAFARQLRGSFELAAAARGLLVEGLRIGSVEISLRFAGPAMRESLLPPFAHLLAGAGREPDGTISLFDSASTGVPAPDLPWPAPAREPGRNPAARYDSGDAFVLASVGTGALTAIERGAAEAVFHLPDAAAVPANERAAPLREALYPLLADRGSYLTHAGAAGFDGRGALIAGASGSGKSTLALSCARAGMDLVADDYVALEVGERALANAMQSTVKLTRRSAELLGFADRFSEADFDRTVEALEKAEVQLESIYPGRLRKRLEIGAVIAPRVAGLERPRLERIGAADALRSLAPSTVLQVRARVGPLLPALARLAGSVPCYSLDLSTDVDANAAAVARALESDDR
jgi:hypothetical protein